MSIYSMTGFGKGEATSENYTMSVEIKSVNNRFKDFKIRMSNLFNAQELELKKKISSKVKRGSFDVFVNYKKSEDSKKTFYIDKTKVELYLSSLKEILEEDYSKVKIGATEFLKSDFIVDEESSKAEELTPLLFSAFEQAVDNLKESRQGEGEKLKEVIKEHLKAYQEHFEKISPLKSKYKEQVEEKLKKKFNEKIADLEIDDSRFNQEVIYYLERYDIDEEISRIIVHLDKFKNLLSTGGEVGRKIDFLVQELNRETNTIGSKSAHEEISACVVEMKVQLEKIREQGLNLE